MSTSKLSAINWPRVPTFLKELKAQLESTNEDVDEASAKLERARDKRSRLEERQRDALERREQAAECVDEFPEGDRPKVFAALDTARAELLGDRHLTLQMCDARERTMRDQLTARIDTEDKRVQRLRDRVLSAMRDYSHAYPEETREVDTSPDAAPEYRRYADSSGFRRASQI